MYVEEDNMQKKIIYILMLALLLAAALTGCKRPNLAVVGNGDNTMTITAVKAPKKYFGGSGFLTVEEGQKIVIDSALNEKGEILLKFSGGPASDGNAEASELTASVSGTDPALEVSVKGPGTSEYEIAAGDYGLYAEVVSKADGTVSISVK